ncbi:MAG: hypothetical protein RIT14_1585 [Pseudomonadota bacterium]|jgi:hypothetical protein
MRQIMANPRILRLRVLSMDEVHLTTAEVLPMLRHRYGLMFYAVILCAVMGMDVGRSVTDAPLELMVPVYAMAVMFGLSAALGLGALIVLWGQSRASVILVPGPVVMLAASFVGHLAGAMAVARMLDTPPEPLSLFLLQTVYFYAAAEALMTLALHGVMPRALGDLRGRPMRRPEDTWLLPPVRQARDEAG